MSSDLGEEVDGASHGPEGRRGDVAVGRLQRPRRVVPEAGRERDARAAACCRLLRGIRRDGTIQQAADVRGEPLAVLAPRSSRSSLRVLPWAPAATRESAAWMDSGEKTRFWLLEADNLFVRRLDSTVRPELVALFRAAAAAAAVSMANQSIFKMCFGVSRY